MTLIIGYSDRLLADCIGLTDCLPVIRSKLLTLRDGTIFGIAGNIPTIELTNSANVDDLLEMYRKQAVHYKQSAMLSLSHKFGLVQTYIGKADQAVNEIASDGLCVGSYRNEAQYRLSHLDDVDHQIDESRSVINDLHSLWGFAEVPCDEFLLKGTV